MKLTQLLADELFQARVQYYGWLSLGLWVSYELRNSITYVVFLSVYAIVDNNASKIKVIKAAREAASQVEDLVDQAQDD